MLSSKRLFLKHCLRSFGTKGGPNLPDIKSVSTRDVNFYNRVEKLRSSWDPPVVTKGEEGVYVGSTYLHQQSLPLLYAAAMLDPKDYCRKSALPSGTSTISGGDAARRLLRGRKNFMETMRQEIHSDTLQKKQFILKGHGVPPQLLQHHLLTAHQWLNQRNDVEQICLENVVQSFDRMLVRDTNGSSRVMLFPQEWEPEMQLYWTVMNRISCHLSRVLVGEPRLKHWRIELCKETSPPEEAAQNEPVIEFRPLETKLSVRLQSSNTSMLFEGLYESSPVEESKFLW